MLEYTGERMVPEASDGGTFWEHVERYRFALRHVCGQRVLDIACGEGYGSAALKTKAASVIGVDVCPETCRHARAKYGIDARVGSAECIPLADSAVDVVVSFETIEHLQDPRAFIGECRRVLAPGGRLIISTPNRPVYHQRTPNNRFHVHEMSIEEFHAVLRPDFRDEFFLGQCVPLPRILTMRGVRRLPSLFYRKFAPHFEVPPSDHDRADVLGAIARPVHAWDRFDPYVVKEMSDESLHRACYLVAVATRR